MTKVLTQERSHFDNFDIKPRRKRNPTTFEKKKFHLPSIHKPVLPRNFDENYDNLDAKAAMLYLRTEGNNNP